MVCVIADVWWFNWFVSVCWVCYCVVVLLCVCFVCDVVVVVRVLLVG